jgi:hypothetical protein
MGADVNREASAFLSGLWKQRQADRVIVVRQQAPKYRVGFKASGAAGWAHEAKLAKRFGVGSVELGETVGALRGLEDVEVVVPEKMQAAGA